MKLLNPYAECFVPNVLLDPVCQNNREICSGYTSMNITPECLTCNTPDLSLSYCDSCDGSITSDWTESNLKPDANLFIPTFRYHSAKEEEDSPYSILKTLWIKNMNTIIFGHLNINSIRNKFDLFVDLVKSKIDIILVSETKIDKTFPNS